METQESPQSQLRLLRRPLQISGLGLFVTLVFALFADTALAQSASGGGSSSGGGGGYMEFRRRAETRQQSRWTLKEWLEQKDRNRMMDLWLGMYAPSPYEFIVGGQYESYDTQISVPVSSSHYTATSGSIAFYAMILGVEGQYENNIAEHFQSSEGLVHLRVLGNSNQGTHLNLSYGARRRSSDGFDLNQQAAGAELDLYIEKHIGLHGLYRVYFPIEEDNLGLTQGTRSEAGAFFDISFMRVYGNWFTDNTSSKMNSVETNTNRSGFQYGLKFYF